VRLQSWQITGAAACRWNGEADSEGCLPAEKIIGLSEGLRNTRWAQNSTSLPAYLLRLALARLWAKSAATEHESSINEAIFSGSSRSAHFTVFHCTLKVESITPDGGSCITVLDFNRSTRFWEGCAKSYTAQVLNQQLYFLK